MKKFRAVCVGNATMDAFVALEPEKLLKKNSVCFAPGSKVEAKNLQLCSGGGATNVAVGLSRRGIRVATVCSVGSDDFGKEILAELRSEKVCTDFVVKAKKFRTAFSVILTGFGDRVILVYRGATRHLLDHGAINFNAFKQAEWVYASSLHSKEGLLEKIFSVAKKSNACIAFNPGQSELRLGLKKLCPLLRKADIFFVNEEEAIQLSGKKSLRDCFKALKKCVLGIVVITRAEKGAMAFDGKRFFEQKALCVKVLDTTGAGDAFNSGFLATIIKGGSIKQGLRAGIKNSESVIKYLGAKNRLLKG